MINKEPAPKGPESISISYPESWSQHKKIEVLERQLAAAVWEAKCRRKDIKALIRHGVFPIAILGIVSCVYFSAVCLKFTETIEQQNKTIETLEKECGR